MVLVVASSIIEDFVSLIHLPHFLFWHPGSCQTLGICLKRVLTKIIPNYRVPVTVGPSAYQAVRLYKGSTVIMSSKDAETLVSRSSRASMSGSSVKRRTANENSAYGSHVMQFGDLHLSVDSLLNYMGTNPANDNYTYVDDNSLWTSSKAVNQRDADL
ncbi:hypothetical protein HAX54_047658 [Datura stramonium]|uniref:Uncharacterized protein n=1 Tax=Datura stramonium TaxID=4076 RepID=A0ABS8SUJ1_DATST|nr:hypothetical protein [Datura stramonium]